MLSVRTALKAFPIGVQGLCFCDVSRILEPGVAADLRVGLSKYPAHWTPQRHTGGSRTGTDERSAGPRFRNVWRRGEMDGNRPHQPAQNFAGSVDNSRGRHSRSDCLGRPTISPKSVLAAKRSCMKKKLAMPRFSSEAEGAKWWDTHHEL